MHVCNVSDKFLFWFMDGPKDGRPVRNYTLCKGKGGISMSDLISVSRSEVLNTASQFSQKQAELEGIMQQVKSQIGTMSSWRGDAQLNFIALMDQWNREIANVHMVLGEVSQQLKQFEANIGAVDTGTRF
jgi:WXG100 family type VII secretion target